jgi:signal transduction histidine kinase
MIAHLSQRAGTLPSVLRAAALLLGLALSRRFSRMLGGDVSVTSEFGAGSHFTLRVPIQPPPED